MGNSIKKICIAACLLISSAPGLYAQGQQVSGTVRDDNGDLAAGTTVVVKGTPVGTTTDANGRYSIQVPDAVSSVLEFSFLGMDAVTETVNGRSTIDVTLSSSHTQLTEVVSIGYGFQQKSHLTGSIAKVDGNSIADIPTSNIIKTLQGRIAGLDIQNASSEVGASQVITIRGSGAMTTGSPLVVVDGVPLDGGLSTVNQRDVASVEVLKDASSAAIYGSRAANGVIMITTKSGQSDKPAYQANFYYGWQEAYQLRELMSLGDYSRQLIYENQWRMEDGLSSSFAGSSSTTTDYASMYMENMLGVYDWQKLSMRNTANTYSANVSVSGGAKSSRYYISGSYIHEEGIVKRNETDKFSLLIKNNIQLTKNVKLALQTNNVYTKVELPAISYTALFYYPSWMPERHNAWTSELTGQPIGSYTHPNDFKGITLPIGDFDPLTGERQLVSGVTGINSTTANPINQVENSFRPNEFFQNVSRAQLTINILKNLTFDSSNSINVRYNPYTTFARSGITPGTSASATYRSTLYVKWLTENTLTWQQKFGKHDLNVMGGASAEKTRYDYAALAASNLPLDIIPTLSLVSEFTTTGTYTRKEEEAMASFFGRVNYNFDNKYLLSAVIRADGSSKFGMNNRWGYFPSVSLGWRASEESFVRDNAAWISNLKLRVSYGITGNDNITRYANDNLLGSAPYYLGDAVMTGYASTTSTMGNPDITWEQVNMLNFGADLGVLDNRISITADLYYSKTKSLLFRRPISSITGFKSQWTNMGAYRAKGLEVTIDAIPVKKRDFNWNISLNVSAVRTRLLDMGGSSELITPGYLGSTHDNRVGGPVTQVYGYKVTGLWLSTDDYEKYPMGVNESTPGLGTLRVEDRDGNGYIDPYDRQPIGDLNPDFTYGLYNSLRFRGFDLSVMIQGVQGGDVVNGEHFIGFIRRLDKNYNMTSRYVSPSYPGDGKTPSENAGIDRMTTDYVIEDASYVSLRNVTFGYTLPKHIADKIGKGMSVRVNFSGNNLYYIWSKAYKGVNPEARYRGTGNSVDYSSPLSPSLQYGSTPIMRTFTFGLELGF